MEVWDTEIHSCRGPSPRQEWAYCCFLTPGYDIVTSVGTACTPCTGAISYGMGPHRGPSEVGKGRRGGGEGATVPISLYPSPMSSENGGGWEK